MRRSFKKAMRLRIRHPNITIAGQTAPGDGICHGEYATVQNGIISEAIGDGTSHKFAAIWGGNGVDELMR
jgi:hypothetical protein